MDGSYVQDAFEHHNTLAFKRREIGILEQRYGRTLHWCNRDWRNDHRGWRGLKPVRFKPDDPFVNDVMKCLVDEPQDIKHQTRDGFIYTGNMVLAAQSLARRDKINHDRTQKATRRLQAAQQGMGLEQEMRAKDAGQVHKYAETNAGRDAFRQFSHTRGEHGSPAHGLSQATAIEPQVHVQPAKTMVFFPSTQSRPASRGRGRK